MSSLFIPKIKLIDKMNIKIPPTPKVRLNQTSSRSSPKVINNISSKVSSTRSTDNKKLLKAGILRAKKSSILQNKFSDVKKKMTIEDIGDFLNKRKTRRATVKVKSLSPQHFINVEENNPNINIAVDKDTAKNPITKKLSYSHDENLAMKKNSFAANCNNSQYGKINNFLFNVETNLFNGATYEFTKNVEFLFRKNIMNCYYQALFAALSLISGVIAVELDYNGAYMRYIRFSEWLCFLSTIGFWFTLFFEYWIDCKMCHYLGKLPEKLWRKNKKKIFDLVFNLCVFFFHPNPAFNGVTVTIYINKFDVHQVLALNAIMYTILLCRVWYIFKLLIVFSRYSTARAARSCEMNKFNINYSFYLKALMDVSPYYVYGLSMFLSLLVCSYALRIYERDLDQYSGFDFSNFTHCIWFTVITMTTVGFGDYYPSTAIGRIIGMFGCFVGVFLVSMLVVTITNVMELAPNELNIFLILERITQEEKKIHHSKLLLSKYFGIIQASKKEDKKKYEANNEILKKKKYEFLYQYQLYKDAANNFELTYPPQTSYDTINENIHDIDLEFQNLEEDQKKVYETVRSIGTKLNIPLPPPINEDIDETDDS